MSRLDATVSTWHLVTLFTVVWAVMYSLMG
jgi:hypothetical protein